MPLGAPGRGCWSISFTTLRIIGQSAQDWIRTSTLIRARDFKSLAAAITPLGQVPHLAVAANRISYSCSSARQLATLLVYEYSCLGNFPESRETHLRYIRCRPRGLSRTFYLPYNVGWTKGISPNPNGSFSSYWRLLRKMQLVFSAILDAGIYSQGTYSLSTCHIVAPCFTCFLHSILTSKGDEWSIFYLLLPSPSKAQAIYFSIPYSGWPYSNLYTAFRSAGAVATLYGRT